MHVALLSTYSAPITCACCEQERPIGDIRGSSVHYADASENLNVGASICAPCIDNGNVVRCDTIDSTHPVACYVHADIVAEVMDGHSGGCYCPLCADNAYDCECCDCRTFDNIETVSHRQVCSPCADRYYRACADCERYLHTRSDWNVTTNNGRICESCYEDNYFCCGNCGEYLHNDDYAEDGYCDACHSDREEEEYGVTVRTGRKRLGTTFDRTFGSKRLIGVELEFSRSSHARSICEETGWGACPDGTSGVAQEFKSPPMSGDQALESIEKFIDLAQEHDLEVAACCGYHLHLDMTGEKELAIARIAAAYQVFLPLWKLFVPQSRRDNGFCNGDRGNGSPEAIAMGRAKPHKEAGNRYCAVNWCSYNEHCTVEIRLHTGTVNARKVVNWARAHLAFINWARSTPIADILECASLSIVDAWNVMTCKAWQGDASLREFYLQRARKFGTELAPAIAPPPPAPVVPERVQLRPSDDRWIVPADWQAQQTAAYEYCAIAREYGVDFNGEYMCDCAGLNCFPRNVERIPELFPNIRPQYAERMPDVRPMEAIPSACVIAGYREERYESDP